MDGGRTPSSPLPPSQKTGYPTIYLRSHKCSEIAHNTSAFAWLQRLNAGRPVLWKVILLPSAIMCGQPRKIGFLYLLFHCAWVDKQMEGASQFWRPTNMNYILRAEKWLKKVQIQFISIVQFAHACVKLLKVVVWYFFMKNNICNFIACFHKFQEPLGTALCSPNNSAAAINEEKLFSKLMQTMALVAHRSHLKIIA